MLVNDRQVGFVEDEMPDQLILGVGIVSRLSRSAADKIERRCI